MYLKLVHLSFVIRKLLTYSLLCLGPCCYGQSIPETELRSDRYVYFNPGALLNIPGGFQIGYEQRIRNNWYWDVEGGVLLFSKVPTLMDFNARNKRGMRFQAGTKFILTDHFFLGPQFLYKRVAMEEEEWFWRFDNAYEQRFNTERIRRTYAFAAELGWQFNSVNSPISCEIAYAFGVQNFRVGYNNILPPDVSFDQLSDVGAEPGTFIYPFFNYRIKVKYALNWDDPIEERVEQKKKEAAQRKSRSKKRSKKKTRSGNRP